MNYFPQAEYRDGPDDRRQQPLLENAWGIFMSCNDPEGGTHHFACFCREEFYRTDRIRMIRKFQEIQKKISGEQFATPELLEKIDRLCRDGIAPNVWQSGDPVNERKEK